MRTALACKPRFSRELFKGAQLRIRRCGILAASPRRPASPCGRTLAEVRLCRPVPATWQRRIFAHSPSSIFARIANLTIPERGIRSDSEPNTFQILVFFPDLCALHVAISFSVAGARSTESSRLGTDRQVGHVCPRFVRQQVARSRRFLGGVRARTIVALRILSLPSLHNGPVINGWH
jgi:hypothetical protein